MELQLKLKTEYAKEYLSRDELSKHTERGAFTRRWCVMPQHSVNNDGYSLSQLRQNICELRYNQRSRDCNMFYHLIHRQVRILPLSIRSHRCRRH